MNNHSVWAELSKEGNRVVRIFKSEKAAFASMRMVVFLLKSTAVGDIRKQLFYRSQGYCELCGDIVTEKSGHMHEQKWRGKGGEISLENSVFICAKTHKLEHKERNPQFTRRKS